MKKANIYKVSLKDLSTKDGKIQITCVATNLQEAINAVTPYIWNSNTNNAEYIKYKENDVLEIKLIETGVTVQSYIPDYKEEEK